MRLIFVRHGEPDYVNDCLTENGILQAKATAERLKKEDIKAVYSSPNGRARETASFTMPLERQLLLCWIRALSDFACRGLSSLFF